MRSEWWYDDSFIDYESLGIRDQEVFLVQLTILENNAAELLFPNGEKKSFSSENDALLWLGDEEYRRLNSLIDDLTEDKRAVATQVIRPSGDTDDELLPQMRFIISPQGL